MSLVWVLTHSLEESMISMLLKRTARVGNNPNCVWKTVCRTQGKKKNAVRLTKISLNAFNGAERAVSPRCMPVRAPFGFAV